MSSTPYPLRLSDSQRKRIKAASNLVGLPFPETARQAIEFGIPVLIRRLAKSRGTNDSRVSSDAP